MKGFRQVGLQQERAIRTRRLMLKSAAEVFDREDYASARLSDISARANMSTGALHFHFANKEDLAQAVVSEARGILWRAARLAYEKNSEPLQALTDISHTLSQLLSWDVVSRAGLRLDNDRSRKGRSSSSTRGTPACSACWTARARRAGSPLRSSCRR